MLAMPLSVQLDVLVDVPPRVARTLVVPLVDVLAATARRAARCDARYADQCAARCALPRVAQTLVVPLVDVLAATAGRAARCACRHRSRCRS